MAYSKWVNPTIAALWRYPVKSMLGERCEELLVDTRGAAGDRLYAVRDAEGKLGSGKNSGRHRRIEGLFGLSAAHEGDLPRITFPDGRSMLANDPGVHAALSAALRTPVTLALEKDVSHYDSAPLHLVTTSSLAGLKKALPGAGIDERRFRPNLVIEGEGENRWIGRTLQVGDEVRLEVVDWTERCVMITMAQSELADEPRILRAVAQGEAEALFGVYAEVRVPGRIRRGDTVVVQ
jgi:uncharacterized protein YcbX